MTMKDEGETHSNLQIEQETEQELTDPLSQLSPPPSAGESLRDSILQVLDHPFFQILGIIVLLLVVVDGAFFFFLLIGAHRMCEPRPDCQPRNDWYNASIQVLNVLFTYMAVVAMPWRVTNLLHLTGWACPRRQNSVGCDLYGIPDAEDIWFHVPSRRGISVLLLSSAVFQFVNQGTRVHFYDFERQDTYPGNVWTNVFFGASFLSSGIAAIWLVVQMAAVRKQSPAKFGPGPIESVKEAIRKRGNESESSERKTTYPDTTRDSMRRSILSEDRGSLRMFAM